MGSKMKFKKLSKKQKEQFFGEIENEGLGYWCQNYGDGFEGTEIEYLAKQVRPLLDRLDEIFAECEESMPEE